MSRYSLWETFCLLYKHPIHTSTGNPSTKSYHLHVQSCQLFLLPHSPEPPLSLTLTNTEASHWPPFLLFCLFWYKANLCAVAGVTCYHCKSDHVTLPPPQGSRPLEIPTYLSHLILSHAPLPLCCGLSGPFSSPAPPWLATLSPSAWDAFPCSLHSRFLPAGSQLKCHLLWEASWSHQCILIPHLAPITIWFFPYVSISLCIV